jgi:hypothetical protein
MIAGLRGTGMIAGKMIAGKMIAGKMMGCASLHPSYALRWHPRD